MSALLPQLVRGTRTRVAMAVPLASSSRALSTSQAVQANVPMKKKANKLPKKNPVNHEEKGRGLGVKSGGITIKTHLARDAPDFSDFTHLYPEKLIPANVALPAVIPRNTFNQLETFGIAKRLQSELSDNFPVTVIRQQTVDIVRSLEGAKNKSSKDARFILSGEQGTGKSILLLQAVSYAIESGWIVLYDPSAVQWVNSTTQFEYNAKDQTFHQPELASKLLTKLLAVNRDRLAGITLPTDVKLHNMTFDKGSKLVDLIPQGIKDLRSSVAAFAAAIDAISQQTEFPFLFAIDDIQSIFKESTYRAPDYTKIQGYQLSTPRLVLDLLGGVTSFKKGAILTALSHSSVNFPPSEELLSGIGAPTKHQLHPYSKLDETSIAYAKSGIERVDIPWAMSAPEAATMFRLWHRKGRVSNGSDEVFLNAWNAAAGNPKEMARSWTKSHYSYIV